MKLLDPFIYLRARTNLKTEKHYRQIQEPPPPVPHTKCKTKYFEAIGNSWKHRHLKWMKNPAKIVNQ